MSPPKKPKQPNFSDKPKRKIYDHTQPDEVILISVPKLVELFDEYATSIKDSNPNLLELLIGIICVAGVFPTSTFKDALGIPANVWPLLYILSIVCGVVKLIHSTLCRFSWSRQVLNKPPLLTMEGLLEKLRDESKLIKE